MSDPQPPADQQGPTFEQALEQLEAIVHALEEGRLGLDESLAQYETGVKLLRRCHGLLARAERRIELLGGIDDAGRGLTEAPSTIGRPRSTKRPKPAPAAARRASRDRRSIARIQWTIPALSFRMGLET